MSVGAAALDHAELVAADRLRRAAGRLRNLGDDERGAVVDVARAVGEAVAACLLEEARREPVLAAALLEIYAPLSVRNVIE